jgi:protein-tyrosine phosphatase
VKYAVVFTLFGAYLLVLAGALGGWAWLLAWPGASFLLLGAAYLGLGPRIYGKRPDGRLAWWALVPLFPYLLLTWVVWHLQRRLGKEPCASEVAPGLWVGRRPFPAELPPGVDLVVDLTAEFRPARGVTTGRDYLCLPTLDALAPEERPLAELVSRVASWPGVVYIHCALGHGRSALVAAGVLLARGLALDVESAERMIRQARPGVRLKRAQRRLLERLAARGPASGGA